MFTWSLKKKSVNVGVNAGSVNAEQKKTTMLKRKATMSGPMLSKKRLCSNKKRLSWGHVEQKHDNAQTKSD
jgi:hypothetical protein